MVSLQLWFVLGWCCRLLVICCFLGGLLKLDLIALCFDGLPVIGCLVVACVYGLVWNAAFVRLVIALHCLRSCGLVCWEIV